MDEIINNIEVVISHLLQAKYDEYSVEISQLINSMMQKFPMIISYYYDPLMNEYVSDATYWPGQLERIIKVVESGDEFAISDVLFNETRPNLMELKSILIEKGILS